jgi:hypothetical protein
MPVVPQISIHVALVWILWGFFMAIGWVLGTWIMGQILGGFRLTNRPSRSISIIVKATAIQILLARSAPVFVVCCQPHGSHM